MVENLIGFEGSHDGNILLVIDSLLRNPFVNVTPIVGQLSNYIIQRLHQKIDLGTAAKFQFEKTIQGLFDYVLYYVIITFSLRSHYVVIK